VKLTNGSVNYPGGWNIVSGGLRLTSQTMLGTASPTTAIPVGSGGTFIVDQFSLSRTLNLNDGSALRGSGASPQTTGLLNVAAGANIRMGTLASSDVLTITGPSNRLNGGAGGTITVDGPGVVALAAPSSYAGAWIVAGGTLRVQNASALGSGT